MSLLQLPTWRGTSLLQVDVGDHVHPLVIRVGGEIDALTAGIFRGCLGAAADLDEVVLDLRDVTFFDASGVRALVEAQAAHPERVHLGATSRPVDLVLEIVGSPVDRVPCDPER